MISLKGCSWYRMYQHRLPVSLLPGPGEGGLEVAAPGPRAQGTLELEGIPPALHRPNAALTAELLLLGVFSFNPEVCALPSP